MTLIRCQDCGNEISDLAPSCPQCGRPRDAPTPPSQKPRRSYRLQIGLILLTLMLCYLAYQSPEDVAKKDVEGDPGIAAFRCQDFVKGQLKAPSTAQFPNPYSAGTTVVRVAPGHYRVTSYVDAQNSFGAQIRTPFICEVKKVPGGDQWQLHNLSM